MIPRINQTKMGAKLHFIVVCLEYDLLDNNRNIRTPALASEAALKDNV